MPFVSDGLALRSDRPESWRLTEPLLYQGRDEVFVVPVGFRTDLASVPQVLTWLIPRYGVYSRAAVLHDYLYRDPAPVSRADADGVFRRVLRELGVSGPRRWMMWSAVRLGSRMSGAGAADWARVLLVAAAVVPLLLPAVVLVQLSLWAFRAAEATGF